MTQVLRGCDELSLVWAVWIKRGIGPCPPQTLRQQTSLLQQKGLAPPPTHQPKLTQATCAPVSQTQQPMHLAVSRGSGTHVLTKSQDSIHPSTLTRLLAPSSALLSFSLLELASFYDSKTPELALCCHTCALRTPSSVCDPTLHPEVRGLTPCWAPAAFGLLQAQSLPGPSQ